MSEFLKIKFFITGKLEFESLNLALQRNAPVFICVCCYIFDSNEFFIYMSVFYHVFIFLANNSDIHSVIKRTILFNFFEIMRWRTYCNVFNLTSKSRIRTFNFWSFPFVLQKLFIVVRTEDHKNRHWCLDPLSSDWFWNVVLLHKFSFVKEKSIVSKHFSDPFVELKQEGSFFCI